MKQKIDDMMSMKFLYNVDQVNLLKIFFRTNVANAVKNNGDLKGYGVTPGTATSPQSP